MCIRDRPWIVKFSSPIGVGEDRLRERGSLSATFYVLKSVIFLMTNDNCRKFKENQIMICIPVSYTHLDVYKRQLVLSLLYVEPREMSVSYTHLDVYKRQRLRESGSLPATSFFIKGNFFLWYTITAANSNRIKWCFAYSPDFLSSKDLLFLVKIV